MTTLQSKRNQYAQYVFLVVLILILASVSYVSYLDITTPLWLKELRHMEFLGLKPKEVSCNDCKESLLYRDTNNPTNCSIVRITSTNKIWKKVKESDQYEVVTQSVEERLNRKGEDAYAFEIKAYKLFEEHCRPKDEEIQR